MKFEFEEEDLNTLSLKISALIKPLLRNDNHVSSDQIFNVRDLAEYLRVSRSWIYQRIRLNEIPYIRVQGQILFRQSQIDKWLEDNQTPACNPASSSIRKRSLKKWA